MIFDYYEIGRTQRWYAELLPEVGPDPKALPAIQRELLFNTRPSTRRRDHPPANPTGNDDRHPYLHP
ncbi:MAG: hypothetical protein AAF317_17335 [Pseudomonadota bacterium]